MKVVLLSAILAGSFMSMTLFGSFADKYREAESYCDGLEEEFQAISNSYELDFENVIPIAFPECVRFSKSQDKMESFALEYAYESFGSKGADFSIGRFQMKPSFAEKVERQIQYLKLGDSLKQRFKYSESDLKSIRGARVERLDSDEWQIHYLCAFYKIMDRKTKDKTWASKTRKLKYYASAYNYGFTSSSKEINDWTDQQSFPYGENGQKKAYASIAIEYYLNIKENE